MTKRHFNFRSLAEKLAPIISRDHIEEMLGGVVSAKHMANLDSLGEGPKRLRIGRKVAYRTEDLLEWLEGQAVELA
jgi:predicted DNA-binding transcriptional regulator AlpA